jgi:hypothetical protein
MLVAVALAANLFFCNGMASRSRRCGADGVQDVVEMSQLPSPRVYSGVARVLVLYVA